MSWIKRCSRCFYSRCLSCPFNVFSDQKCLPRTRFASEKWNTKCCLYGTSKTTKSGEFTRCQSVTSRFVTFDIRRGSWRTWKTMFRSRCVKRSINLQVLLCKWEVQLVREIPAILMYHHLLFKNSKHKSSWYLFGTRNDGTPISGTQSPVATQFYQIRTGGEGWVKSNSVAYR